MSLEDRIKGSAGTVVRGIKDYVTGESEYDKYLRLQRNDALYRACQYLARGVMWAFYNKEIEGEIPTEGVVLMKHQRTADLFLGLTFMPPSYIISKKENYFLGLRNIIGNIGALPVNRDRPLSAVNSRLNKLLGEIIENKDIVVIAPEATRADGYMQDFKNGLYFAAKAYVDRWKKENPYLDAPDFPVTVIGASYPEKSDWRRYFWNPPPVRINIAEPLIFRGNEPVKHEAESAED